MYFDVNKLTRWTFQMKLERWLFQTWPDIGLLQSAHAHMIVLVSSSYNVADTWINVDNFKRKTYRYFKTK